MTKLADLDLTILSGFTHIDALLDSGPDWNFQTRPGNVIYYTFSITSGNERGTFGHEAFDAGQQAATRQIMEVYLKDLTGISFVETMDGSAAQVQFCYRDLAGPGTVGECAWYAPYTISAGDEIASFLPKAHIYLDNNQFAAHNKDLSPTSFGHETLLHEIGHMLGLKHPFEAQPENPAVLPALEDDSRNTLMSYDLNYTLTGVFSPYDVAALAWIYGGDGLGGEYGMGSVSGGRYLIATERDDRLTGTAAGDKLQGLGGNDLLDGAAGVDTAIYLGPRADYEIDTVDGKLRVTGHDATSTLTSIEFLQFDDARLAAADLFDRIAPAAPSLMASANDAGFSFGDSARFRGEAESNATIRLYLGSELVGSALVRDGGYDVVTRPFPDGTHVVTATLTDLAGNTSAVSASASFMIDHTKPAAPTASATFPEGGNQLRLSGTADPGTTLRLFNTAGDYQGIPMVTQPIAADGRWALTTIPLPDGHYAIGVESRDLADNVNHAPYLPYLTLASPLNRNGTFGNDTLRGDSGNNAFVGNYGVDSVVYGGARADYTIARPTDYQYRNSHTHTVTSTADGVDALYGIERIHFSDRSLALDTGEIAGQAYRLYRAAFDRAPDQTGLGFWIAMMDQGIQQLDVAQGFIVSAEFTAIYGLGASDLAFMTKLYQHVLHRAPDDDGFQFWMNSLHEGTSRAQVLNYFSESFENIAQVVGAIQGGVEYIPFAG